MTTSNQNKEEIRKGLKKQRLALSSSQQKEKSNNIIDQVISADMYRSAHKVAFYLSVRGEADPQELMLLDEVKDEDEPSSKQFYLPVLSKDKGEGLVFARITKDTTYQNNKFSIPEPLFCEGDLINAKELDLVIMPLLGFDRQGNRLGMGGGYYDRCFAFKNKKKAKPNLMGFAYNFQEVETLTAESWDIPLDLIATESEMILPNA